MIQAQLQEEIKAAQDARAAHEEQVKLDMEKQQIELEMVKR